jgi:pyruvate dehydrogenase E2 component (dihydrolipoamide acetyltransferase)
MAFEIVMPRLGWTMESGSVAEWHKRDGDFVQAGDILLSVEAEKAIQEVEAFESGILRIPPTSPAPGAPVPVGTLLGYLVAPGEPTPPTPLMSQATPARPGPVPPQAPPPAPARREQGAGGGPSSGAGPAISPRARRVAHELGVEWQRLTGTGRDGRIEERDVRAAAAKEK